MEQRTTKETPTGLMNRIYNKKNKAKRKREV